MSAAPASRSFPARLRAAARTLRRRLRGAPNDDRTVERSWMVGASPVRVGRFTYGEAQMQVLEWGEGAGLTIGPFCSLAEGLVVMLGGGHDVGRISAYPFGHVRRTPFDGGDPTHPQTRGDVTVGADVWIGRGVTILSGVTIGDGAVIAAGSHVVSDVAPYQIVGGNPARPLRLRFEPEVIAALLALRWWDWPVERIKRHEDILRAPPTPEALRALAAAAANPAEPAPETRAGDAAGQAPGDAAP